MMILRVFKSTVSSNVAIRAVMLFNEPAKVRSAHIKFASEKTFVLYIYLGNIDLLLQLLYKADIREIKKRFK